MLMLGSAQTVQPLQNGTSAEEIGDQGEGEHDSLSFL